MQIIECIPNFSEGRDKKTIEALSLAAESVPGVMMLGVSSDWDHNRSVITIAGNVRGIEEAAFILCKTAAERINLLKHNGVHPRIGATDVIPFVPISNSTMDECVEISKRVGRRIAEELSIPVFLYEESASSPERKNLAEIRRGGFEGMREKILNCNWKPDFGESKIHPNAGATAVGARKILIAFNVNLDTQDVSIAKKIAGRIRESGGGYKCLKAIGVKLSALGLAQVSMNLTDYEETPVHTAFEAVQREAASFGVNVAGSEVIGFIPARAITESAARYLKLDNFSYETHVLESFGICAGSHKT